VIKQQLMLTARTLEAEWRQVLRGSVSKGERKMSQVLGAFGLLDFTMLRPVLEDESSTGCVWAAGFHHVMARSRLAGVLKLTNCLFL
jgi:hypothetical protein